MAYLNGIRLLHLGQIFLSFVYRLPLYACQFQQCLEHILHIIAFNHYLQLADSLDALIKTNDSVQ